MQLTAGLQRPLIFYIYMHAHVPVTLVQSCMYTFTVFVVNIVNIS